MGIKIVLDPGHGGEPGAVGPAGTKEKVINLAVAFRVAAILRPVAEVIMTREADVDMSLQARAIMADEADAFVSIHCNAADKPGAHGTETLHYPGSVWGRRLAQAIQQRVVAALDTADRGLKERSDLAVLRLTNPPAALVEIAFLSNPAEEAMLNDPTTHAKAAEAIAQGIADCFEFVLHPEYDPVKEIAKLREAGLINSDHKSGDPVTWGEFATVLNRLRKE